MAEREDLVRTFLATCGWNDAARVPLAGDASFRRYYRLCRGAETAVLADAPPPREDIRPFARMARHLRSLGYSAPGILAADTERGLLLLEDLGDETYTRVLAEGGDEAALYALAVDVLIDLHRRASDDAIPAGLSPYDTDKLLDEARLLIEWYWPAVSGRETRRALRREYEDIWRTLFYKIHGRPPTLVLRDYHVDNLMRLPGRDGVAACGLLDFQDAVAGPRAYDLMSLLEDARRDIGPELAKEMLDRYFAAFPDLDRKTFETDYAILGAGRHAKVIGIFTRLSVRDGKAGYLVHIPRVWRLLARSLAHPALAPMARWLDRAIPPAMRKIPPCRAGRPN